MIKEKTSKTIKSNCQPNTTMPAKPCPEVLVIVREGTLVTVKFNQQLNVGKFWMQGRIKAIFLNVWERKGIRACWDG